VVNFTNKFVSDSVVMNTTIETKYIEIGKEFTFITKLVKNNLKAHLCGIKTAKKVMFVKLESPPGQGKTLIAHEIAKLFNANLYIDKGTPNTTCIDLEGYYTSDEKGNIIFKAGRMVLSMLDSNKNGFAVYLINEINAIPESEQIGINELTDFQAQLNLASKSDETVKVNDGCFLLVIGTMNYDVSGVNRIQESLDSRSTFEIQLPYPPQDKEVEILTKLIRETRKIKKLPKPISTRELKNFIELIKLCGKDPEMINLITENSIISKLAYKEVDKEKIRGFIRGQGLEDLINDNIDSFAYTYEIEPKPTTTKKPIVKKKVITNGIRLGKFEKELITYMKNHTKSITSTELSKIFGRESSHVNQTLRSLEIKGFTKHTEISSRKYTWRITEKGKKLNW
jgi:hypothetical protein